MTFPGLPHLIVVGLAGLVTFGLFWAMQALIGVSGELQEGGRSPSVEFVRLRKDRQIETKKREPPRREKPEQAPPPPQMNMAQNLNPGDATGAIIPLADTGAQLAESTGMGLGGGDGDAVPLVRVDPEYPPRARAQGISGWVHVAFTITPAGTVTDPQVVSSEPSYIFDRSALQAVRRWRYSPRVVNGKAVARQQEVRLRFDPGAGR